MVNSGTWGWRLLAGKEQAVARNLVPQCRLFSKQYGKQFTMMKMNFEQEANEWVMLFIQTYCC